MIGHVETDRWRETQRKPVPAGTNDVPFRSDQNHIHVLRHPQRQLTLPYLDIANALRA
jgi:hypothetical protein